MGGIASRATPPLRSDFIAGFEITEAEIADVVAFLESLTDARILSEPRHRNPRAMPDCKHFKPMESKP